MTATRSLGEFEIIARYFAAHDRRADVLLGIGDDAAVLDVRSDRKLVVATDTIVAGVHFPAQTAPAEIGYRALAVNLSDLAAMGAEPSWMTLSLSLPSASESWIAELAAGLFELADRHQVVLVGGDTVRGPLVITVQLAGWVEPDRWLTRSGAKAGDVLMISGVTGEAAAGLQVIQQQLPAGAAATHLQRRFFRPEPRVALGRRLRTIASAAMDVSDGLLTDLAKLCEASNCGAQLDVDRLPASAAMRELFPENACIDYALAGGDDYELIFTVPPQQAGALTATAGEPALTKIGVITAGRSVQCTRGGAPFAPRRTGYDHFSTPGTNMTGQF
jgi:thiamine-monophosphate kinase